MAESDEPPFSRAREHQRPAFSVPKFVLGLFLPAVALAVTYVIALVVVEFVFEGGGGTAAGILGLIAIATAPLLLVIMASMWMARGQRELALGVAAGIGLILLFVAACSGLVMMG